MIPESLGIIIRLGIAGLLRPILIAEHDNWQYKIKEDQELPKSNTGL